MKEKPYESYTIISDLDGTIIPHGGCVSEANKRAIAAFIEGGGHFGIATGRTPEAAAGYLTDVAITAPSIFFNGSMLYDWQAGALLVEGTQSVTVKNALMREAPRSRAASMRLQSSFSALE